MDTKPARPRVRAPISAVQQLVELGQRPADRIRLAGPYAELVWGPLVGPVGILAARRLCLALLTPGDRTVNLNALAANLGVGNGEHRDVVGSHHRIVVALHRADHFGLIDWRPEQATIRLSGWAPEVPPRLLRRLPTEAQAHHRHMISPLRGRAAPPPVRPSFPAEWPAPPAPDIADQPLSPIRHAERSVRRPPRRPDPSVQVIEPVTPATEVAGRSCPYTESRAMPTPTPAGDDRYANVAPDTPDAVMLSDVLDAATDRIVRCLASRATEWTTSAAEQAIIARLAAEAAQRAERHRAPFPPTTPATSDR